MFGIKRFEYHQEIGLRHLIAQYVEEEEKQWSLEARQGSRMFLTAAFDYVWCLRQYCFRIIA